MENNHMARTQIERLDDDRYPQITLRQMLSHTSQMCHAIGWPSSLTGRTCWKC